MFYVELVWNREFHFVQYGEGHQDLESAIKLADRMADMSNGECVKETRVVDEDGKVVFEYGRAVRHEKET